MKSILLLFLTAIVLFSCVTTPPMGSSSSYSEQDAFENQLDTMERVRTEQSNLALIFSIGFLATFVGGIVVQNLGSFGVMGKDESNYLTVGLYGASTVAAVIDIVQILSWKQTTDEYLQLLRLQTQYYNMISPVPNR